MSSTRCTCPLIHGRTTGAVWFARATTNPWCPAHGTDTLDPDLAAALDQMDTTAPAREEP